MGVHYPTDWHFLASYPTLHGDCDVHRATGPEICDLCYEFASLGWVFSFRGAAQETVICQACMPSFHDPNGRPRSDAERHALVAAGLARWWKVGGYLTFVNPGKWAAPGGMEPPI